MLEQRLILVNLLIKLGVAAAVASGLVRSVEFKSLLFREERTLRQRDLSGAVDRRSVQPWACGSASRQTSFLAGDLSFETAMLLGVRRAAIRNSGRALLALPALLHGEWATLPFIVLCGFWRGNCARSRPIRKTSGRFRPSSIRHLSLDPAQSARAALFRLAGLFFITIVGLRFMQTEIHRVLPHTTFSLESPNWWVRY